MKMKSLKFRSLQSQVSALEVCEAHGLRWKQLAEIQQSHEETLAQEEAMWRQLAQETEQLRIKEADPF